MGETGSGDVPILCEWRDALEAKRVLCALFTCERAPPISDGGGSVLRGSGTTTSGGGRHDGVVRACVRLAAACGGERESLSSETCGGFSLGDSFLPAVDNGPSPVRPAYASL